MVNTKKSTRKPRSTESVAQDSNSEYEHVNPITRSRAEGKDESNKGVTDEQDSSSLGRESNEPSSNIVPTSPKRESLEESLSGNFESQNQLNQQGKEEYDRVYEPLDSLSEPIRVNDANPRNFQVVALSFPGCEPLDSSSYDSSFLRKRIESALALGNRYLIRTLSYSNARRLTRSEVRTTFKEVIALLNKLLTEVIEYTNEIKSDGYAIQRDLLRELNEKLSLWRELGKPDLIYLGEGMIELPMWGPRGRAGEFWKDNDFEIFGACYRKEVEEFLATIIDAINAGAERKAKVESDPQELYAGMDTIRNLVKGQLRSPQRQSSQVRFEQSNFGAQEGDPFGSISSVSRSTNPFALSNRNSSIFGQPKRLSTGRKIQEIFGNSGRRSDERNTFGSRNDEIEGRNEAGRQSPPHKRQASGGSPDGGDDSDDSGDGDGPRRKGPRGKGNKNLPRRDETDNEEPVYSREIQFDNKLKIEIIPTWDGNTDEMVRWFEKVNRIAEQSSLVFKQLGSLVPSRLRDSAEIWYFSLPVSTRHYYERNWRSLKEGIAGYYMTRTFMEKQKIRANKTTYRESGHTKETPSEYYIRKLDLIQLVYDYSDSEIITEIMNGAPSSWTSILTPHLYDELTEFQRIIRFHEDTLITLDSPRNFNPYYREGNYRNQGGGGTNPFRNARTNLVGASNTLPPPQYPKDDSNVSKKATPESKGARPCRHCGSGKHWDPECRHSRKAQRQARVNKVTIEDEDALEAYEDLYYDLLSDDEEDKDFQ